MPSALSLDKLEDRRRHLVRFIEQHAPQGSPNNRVTIVFDGDLDIFGGMTSTTAKIIFSQGESADDKIKRIVSQAENVKNVVVVSDDMEMGAIVTRFDIGEAAVRFLEAGGDLILVCRDADRQRQALAAVESAVRSGRLSERRVEASLDRLARFRSRIVPHPVVPDPETVLSILRTG